LISLSAAGHNQQAERRGDCGAGRRHEERAGIVVEHGVDVRTHRHGRASAATLGRLSAAA